MIRAAAKSATNTLDSLTTATLRGGHRGVTHMAAHRRGNQVSPAYALIAENEPDRNLEPALARLMAVRADLAEPSVSPSDAALGADIDHLIRTH